MDFFSTIRILQQRWKVVAGTLFVGLVVATAVASSLSSTFQARGSALLVGAPAASTVDEEAGPSNPFTRLDGSTAVLTAVATQIMDDGPIRESLAEQGAAEDYQVGQADDGTPVFVVVATNPDAQVALDTVDLVLERLGEELDSRQADAGAPEDSRVRSIVITQSSEAQQLVGSKVRTFLALAALATAASVSVALVVDALARRRDGAGAAAGEGPTRLDRSREDGEPVVDGAARGGAGPQAGRRAQGRGSKQTRSRTGGGQPRRR